MKVCAIIQARMGSTRLPRKAMLDIEGHPMLWHVVNRIKACEQVDEIIVATTTNQEDQRIEDYCKKNNVHCFRGSSEDVLERYYQAAQFYNTDTIVRITSDCPLIDPRIVDNVIAAYKENMKQYAGASVVVERTYPRGLDCEVFSFEALERLHRNVKEARYREHVTLYMYEHETVFPLVNVKNDIDLSMYRWTVDEENDLKLIRKIYKYMKNEKVEFGFKDVLQLMKKQPSLMHINEGVQQKTY